jgi:chromate transporter
VAAAQPTPRVPLRTVLREWGRIGTVGFGGPPAHVALLRELVVERRRWLGAREFEDAFAACNLLPGPASTQLAIYCARRVAGVRGAFAGGLAFILPGLVAILAIAAVALSDEPPEWVRGFGAGAAAAVVAVVVQAGVQLARSSLEGRDPGARARALAYGVAAAVVTVLAGAAVVLVLLAAGLAELAWRRRGSASVHAWPPLLALVAAADSRDLPALAWTAFKVGALAYGGGFVIIALMRDDAVSHGWMTAAEFANAVAYGQITPGPVTHTVALVGWAAGGPLGALVATVIAFAPSFAIVALAGERFDRLRASANARAFLDGAGPAAVGAILGAAVTLAGTVDTWWQVAVLIGAAAILLLRRSPVWALLGGGLAGLAATAAGLAIPA